MVEEIISEYGLDSSQVTIEAINNGLINQTWRVHNDTSDYILQKVNHNIFKNPDSIAENCRLIAEFLSVQNPDYLFVAPIQTLSHTEYAHYKGEGYYRLAPFVKNSHTLTAATHPQQAFEGAKAFGKFTALLADFPADKLKVTLPDFHNLSLRYAQFETALETADAEKLKKCREIIDFAIANKNIVDTYESILKNPDFKHRVTHHDTKISNVLFDKENKNICVIDLDTVMPGYFISDLGDMMRTYLAEATEEESDFSKIEIRTEYFDAVCKGYWVHMCETLTDAEKEHFIYAGKFMIYMQGLRFLTDYLNNDIYYGAKYPEHNFVRAGNQVALLKKLLEKEDTFQENLNVFLQQKASF